MIIKLILTVLLPVTAIHIDHLLLHGLTIVAIVVLWAAPYIKGGSK